MIQIKRYFITLVALFAMLALGGCGGGDNASSTVGESLENTQSVSLVEASKIQFSTATVQEKSSGTIATTSGGETIFSLTVRYQKNLNDNYDVSIDMTAVEIDGCEVSNVVFTPNPVVLNGNLNSTEALTVSGNVNSDCQNDTRYTLGGTVNISNGENRTQEPLLVSSQSLTDVAVEEGATDAVIDPDAPQTDEGYMFGNTNAPVTITPNQQTYELRVQLLKDELVAEGKEITLKAFDAVYGNVKDYSVTTGTDGYAVFEYTAPATLPESGTTVTLTFVYIDTNNTELTKEFTLKFESADVPTEDELVDTSSYHIDLLPTVLSISEAEETQPITLQVLNTNNVPVAGIAVYATTGGLANGVLSQYEGVSDANGKVSFSYTAPQTLPTTPVEIKFAFENATDAKEQIVTVNFIPITYSMESDANITVSALDSDYPISVTVKAQEGSDPVQPAVGAVVIAEVLDAVNGSLATYEVTVGDSGVATFMYHSPKDALPTTDATVKFSLKEAPSVTVETTLHFTEDVVDTSDYTLSVAPVEVNVTQPEAIESITLLVVDGDNKPVEGVALFAQALSLGEGELNSYRGVSDANGKVSFSYTAPQTLPTTPVEIKFAFENATDAKEQIVTVNFIPITYSMESDANITVSALDSDYPISVTVKAQEGSDPVQPAVGAVVIAEVLDAVNGSLATYEVTVGDSGVATFMYHSPVRTLPENNVSVKFYLKEDMTQTAETKLLFDPVVVDTVAQVYLSPASLIITEANVTKKITIVTVNADNIGISTELQVEQPNNGTDYGHFDLSTVTTDASGYAELLYTAPSDISNLNERNISITELSQNITQQLRIRFTTLTSSKNYEIVERVPDNLGVDGFGSMGIRIEEVGAEGKLIDDSNVKEVNVTTLFENMLLVGAGETMMQYSGIADQGGIKLEAQHLSGVAMVEVSALINDGENDVVITKLVPVTVLSGPVTSMSLAYVGSEVDESGLFLNHYVLHAVDQYANPAREGLVFHPALVSGTKVVVPNPLMVGGTGELLNGTPSFRDNGTSFADVSAEDNDRVIVMPNLRDYYVQDYIGNWKISEVISEHELAFESVFSGEEKENLSYVIGSDKRAFDGGLLIATADVANPDGLFVLGKDGTAPLEVKFDPVLAGHTYVMGAYIDDGNRTGVAIKEAFRWGGYTSTTKEVDNDGSSYTVGLQLGIEGGGSAEHLKELTLASDSFVLDHPEECDINVSASDFTTDDNGYVVLEVITAGSDDEVKTCSVTWNKNPGSILYEY